jgi:hypothetical protein
VELGLSGQRSEKLGHRIFVFWLDDPNGGGGAVAQYEPAGVRGVLGGKRQIAGVNRGHVGLLSSRAEIFKVDLVWT